LSRRAAIFAALAQGLDLPEVLARFNLSRDELRQLFQEAAAYYRQQEPEPEKEPQPQPQPQPEPGVWRLFSDGASRGNPGPAGAGALLYDPRGEIRARVARYLGETTNNVAEYQALIFGLQAARQHKVRRLQVFADSELLVRQLTGRYRVKSPHLLPLWREAVRELQQFATWSVSHVPREENHLADELANQAIDRGRKSR